MRITLEKVLYWFVIGGIFTSSLIALIAVPSTYVPSDAAKAFTFRIIVELIASAWLVLAIVFDKYRPRRSSILGAFAVFVLVMAIADAQGANPYVSFWSNYQRMDGWINLIHVFMFIVVTSSMLTTEKTWSSLFQVSIIISFLVGLSGLSQLAEVPSVVNYQQSGVSARIDATFDNPSTLAAYMLFNIFIATYLWTKRWDGLPHNKQLVPSIAYASVIVLDTFILLFTGTRGAILGLVVGGIVTLLIFAFVLGSHRAHWTAVAAIVGVIVLASSLALTDQTSFVRKIGFIDRLASISFNDPSAKSRLSYIKMAWQGVKERPILGWGQENYPIVYSKYVDSPIRNPDPSRDRVHNIIFDQLIAGGFVGLFGYLSIFATALWGLWRRNTFSVSDQAILSGLFAAYFFQNLFFFDSTTSYILLGTVLAYIVSRSYRDMQEHAIISKMAPRRSFLLPSR
jgi:O-antigen ligase